MKTPTRKNLAALFADPTAPAPVLGLTTFRAESVEGLPALRSINWHGSSSVIASWQKGSTNPALLIRVIWHNRRHYRRPFPLASFYNQKP